MEALFLYSKQDHKVLAAIGHDGEGFDYNEINEIAKAFGKFIESEVSWAPTDAGLTYSSRDVRRAIYRRLGL